MLVMKYSVRLLMGIALAGLLAVGPALAGDHDTGPEGHDDHDLARDLYEHGVIRSLEDVLSAVAAQVPGEVIGVDLVQSPTGWIYRVEVVTANGQRKVVRVDAERATVVTNATSGSS